MQYVRLGVVRADVTERMAEAMRTDYEPAGTAANLAEAQRWVNERTLGTGRNAE